MTGDELNYREAFLQANARNEVIAAEMEDLLRILMRGIASQNPSNNVSKAVDKLLWIIDLAARCDDLRLYNVINDALAGFADVDRSDIVERAYIDAAKDGMMFLVESSASDGFAKGRASKRQSAFLQSLKPIEFAREQRRRDRQAGLE